MRTGSTRRQRGGLSTRSGEIFFVTLPMKFSKTAELQSSNNSTVLVASSEAGTTISAEGGTSTTDTTSADGGISTGDTSTTGTTSAEGGTSTGVTGVAAYECPSRPPESNDPSWETLAAEARSRNS